MKYIILKWTYRLFYCLGVFKLFYFLKRKQQTVITYHNVISDDIFNSDLLHLGVSCSESSFIKQIDIVSSRFRITTDVGVQKTCIISFDDGYRNNIEIAAPHLTKRGIFGLFFVPACYFDNHFGTDHTLWVDKILMWISYIPIGNYAILGSRFDITNDHQRRRCLWVHINQEIMSNYSKLEMILKELDSQYPFGELKKIINNKMYQSRFEAMTVEELNSLKEMGHKVACHSFKHDILSLLSDEQLEHDFLMCQRYSKEYNINFYAYPFGGKDEISPNVIKMCKKYGYSAAFVNNEMGNQDSYTLGRISLDNQMDKYFIEARLCGFEQALKKIIKIRLSNKKIIETIRRKSFDENKTALRD